MMALKRNWKLSIKKGLQKLQTFSGKYPNPSDDSYLLLKTSKDSEVVESFYRAPPDNSRDGSRTTAASKMERFAIIAVNHYHKALHLGCCSSPRFASEELDSEYHSVEETS